MKILGINACLSLDLDGNIRSVDGGGACLMIDGEISIGITEERITKKKYDGGFDNAVNYILSNSNLKLDEIDYLVCSFYGVPYNIPEKLLSRVKEMLGLSKDENKLIIMPSHHLSHAYSAYFLSSFNEALIIVNDNEGQIIEGDNSIPLFQTICERNSYYIARENNIKLIKRDFDYSGAIGFGKMYNKFTKFLGFDSYHDAGKTMGLSPYSQFDFNDYGDLYYFDFNDKLCSIIEDSGDYISDVKKMLKLVGFPDVSPRLSKSPMTQIYSEIAGYIQYQLEKWQEAVVKKLHEKFEFMNICISGGVALNCPTNTRMLNLDFINEVFIPSAPQDQGLCIGNVIYGDILQNNLFDSDRKYYTEKLYLGKKYDLSKEKIIKMVLKYKNLRLYTMSSDEKNKIVAKLLSEGNIVALYQGKSEFGPRALGNRSIIADPRDYFIKDRINIDIKNRENFRPFAPSVIEEKTLKYFDFCGKSPSMMFTSKVRNNYLSKLPAITHVDNSARLQTVNKESNSEYYNLIVEFGKITGIEMVLNTSFNLNGMPIVETPQDAIDCFANSRLDYLVLENILISRTERS